LRQGIFDRCLAEVFGRLEAEFEDCPDVRRWFEMTRIDMGNNPGLFQDSKEDEQHTPALERPELKRYHLNLLVDNSNIQGAPVLYEDNPGYQNLVGRVEHISSQGTLLTDFSLIKGGALHSANGGYLILDAEKILSTPFVWPTLKRVLKAQELRIESLERVLSLATTISLEPEPAPIRLKVVLIGERSLYFLLKEYDPEFIELFKVAADFADDLERTADNEQQFAQAILKLQQEDGLKPIELAAICRIIEQAARLAEDGERLSLRLERIRELVHEADYWASKAGHTQISAGDIQTALDAQARRMGQWRERLQGHIRRGLLMIDTKGSQLGRVNALSVLELGDYSFGTASRISATARLGHGEIIDIAREVDQGGQIHTKGVMILSAYLARRYAKNQPLSLNASLVFEQTYGSIDGDSASAAELCALLSAIADLPIRQSLAITGSVNQHGEIQVIGGVNEKIEGFFNICRDRGLDGSQGVIIPRGNCKDLMLHHELRQAAAEGQFHIYAVSHVEEAMELLTGLVPGIQDSQGLFTPGSFNHQIQVRLLEWMTLHRHYSSSTS
jgi:lon-related putative ATP-dependent protease